MNNETTYLLETAIRAAREGGQLALSRLDHPGYRKWKGPGDLLASAVLEMQERIVEVIRQELPDANFLLEESEAAQDEGANPLWIIDPLDGSLNFFHGIPSFAISIAYRLNSTYRLGVVYDPCRDELFHAALNGGAFLNGQPIHVDKFSDGMDALHAAMVGTDWRGSTEDIKRAFQLARFVAGEVLHIQNVGAPTLGLCYVAAGRLHAYYGLEYLRLWDVAAASVILQAAGGVLTDIAGGSWLYAQEGYLATNGVIHGSMLGVISPVRKLQRQSVALRQGQALAVES